MGWSETHKITWPHLLPTLEWHHFHAHPFEMISFQPKGKCLVLTPTRLFLLCFFPKNTPFPFRQSGSSGCYPKLLRTQIFISATTRLHYSAFVSSFALTDYFNSSPLCGTLAVPFLIFRAFILRVESLAFSGHVHPTQGWIGFKPTFLLSYTPQIRRRHMSRTLHHGTTVTSTWADFLKRNLWCHLKRFQLPQLGKPPAWKWQIIKKQLNIFICPHFYFVLLTMLMLTPSEPGKPFMSEAFQDIGAKRWCWVWVS